MKKYVSFLMLLCFIFLNNLSIDAKNITIERGKINKDRINTSYAAQIPMDIQQDYNHLMVTMNEQVENIELTIEDFKGNIYYSDLVITDDNIKVIDVPHLNEGEYIIVIELNNEIYSGYFEK